MGFNLKNQKVGCSISNLRNRRKTFSIRGLTDSTAVKLLDIVRVVVVIIFQISLLNFYWYNRSLIRQRGRQKMSA